MHARHWKALGLLFLVPPVLGFVLDVLAGWPGAISPDMANTILEASTFRFLGHQEPFLGLVWAGVLAVVRLPTAVAAFYLMESLGYWLAFALLTQCAVREKSLLMAALAAVAGFLPPLFCFVVMVESNIHVGVAWLLAIAIAVAFPVRRSLLACLPMIFFGYTARSGMIIALAPVLIACYMLTNRHLSRLRVAVYGIATAAVFCVSSVAVEKLVLGAPTRDHVLSVSELFDIAGIYERTGTHCLPASVVPPSTTAEAILAEYDPRIVSSIIWANKKGGFILPDTPEEFARLKRCWMQTIREHPADYLAVKLRFARLFLMIGVDQAFGYFPDCSANKGLGIPNPDDRRWKPLLDYSEGSVTSLVWKGWFWFLVSGLTCTAALVLGAARADAAFAIYVSAWCSIIPQFVFGQATLCRYYFLPYCLCVASLLMIGKPLLVAVRDRWSGAALRSSSGATTIADRRAPSVRG